MDSARPLPWRNAPLTTAALLLALGLVLEGRLTLGVGAWLGLGVGAWLGGMAMLALGRRRLVSLRRLAATGAVAVVVLALGGVRQAGGSVEEESMLASLAAEAEAMPHAFDVTVRGRIVGAVTETDRFVRFRLRTDSVGTAPLYAAPGLVEATLWHPRETPPGEIRPRYPHLVPGDWVRLDGRLRPRPERRNPADFDYGAFLARQGVDALVSATDSAAVVHIARTPTRSEAVVTAARATIRRHLHAHIRSDEARGVLEALLLADRSGVARETREAFARMGLAHLLAVSGLHILLVGMVLYGVLKPMLHRLGWRWRTVELVRLGLTLAAIGGYVWIVGAPPSASRALVMAALLLVGRAFERTSGALNGLGAAALVLLLIRPAALFDVGFQLSFAAVGGLVLLIPVLERPIPEAWRAGPVRRWAVGLTLASTAATLGTAPVTLFHFGQVPLAGLVLNLVAIPATGAALSAGLLVVLTAGWAPALAWAFGGAAELFTHVVLITGGLGNAFLGWTAVGDFVPMGWGLAALVAALFALATWPRPRARWRLTGAALGCAAFAVWLPLLGGPKPATLDALFLDVGQGDAVLLSLPNGRTVLVDAGPRDPYTDAGERVLLPHLDRFGIDRLDAVVISHAHSDHLGGLPALVRAGRVGRAFHNGQPFDSELLAETERVTAAHGVPWIPVAAGDTLALDEAVAIHVLYASPDPAVPANDASVVLMVVFGETRFLLTGDAEMVAEAELVARYGDLLCADLVKMGHHGSRTSSTPAFVEAAACDRTRFAVAQVAHRNRYHLPNAEVLDRWRATGAEVLTTAEHGAVWFRSDGRTVSQVAWR